MKEHRLTSALPLAECRARLSRLPAAPPTSPTAQPVICGRVSGTSFRLHAEQADRRFLRRYFYGALSASPEGTLIVGRFQRSRLVRLATQLYLVFLLLSVGHVVLLAGVLVRQQLAELLVCGVLIAALAAWIQLKRRQENRRVLEFLAEALDARQA